MSDSNIIKLVTLGIAVCITLAVGSCSIKSVDQGTVAAGYRYGTFQYVLEPGFHMVNPLNSFHEIDTKQKTESLQEVEIPSQDQLTSTVDVSVQYRAIGDMAESIVSDTGSVEQVINVHMIPKIRSLIRDAGRTVERAEALYTENVTSDLANGMTNDLREFMQPKGIAVEAVLIRNINLPQFIVAAIQKKKEREQKAEEQKAELARFETEQQQLVAQAQAELDAAQKEAEMKKVLADAEAYEIEAQGKALETYPAILQFRALTTLTDMSKDPAAKLYWMDSNSSNPLPLMHLGQVK